MKKLKPISPTPRAPRVRVRLDPQERRQDLLRVAGELLTKGGIEALQFSELALAAGVTRPVVYKFFATRHELIAAILEDFEAELRARFQEAGERSVAFSVEESVHYFIEAVCDTIELKGAGAWRLLDSKGAYDDVGRVARAAHKRLIAPWMQKIAEVTGAPRTEVETVSRMMVAAARVALERWYDGQLTRQAAAAATTRGVFGLLSAFTIEERRAPRLAERSAMKGKAAN